MKETYVKAKERILAELHTYQWDVHVKDRQGRALKFPYAKKDGRRLDFKAQAVYLDGHSLFIDIRDTACARFAEYVNGTIDARKEYEQT